MIVDVDITPCAPWPRNGTRAERLAAYVAGAAQARFRWGTHDCARFVTSWIAGEAGWDLLDAPMKNYTSGVAAVELLAERGGLMQAFADRCRAAGFAETDAPAPGDVGVVNNGRPLCALRTENYWASLSARGVVLLPAWTPLFVAFALPHPD